MAGPSPLKVTFIGGGLAVGYGVDSRRDAIDGRVAEELGARTDRGVLVINNAKHRAKIDDQIAEAAVTAGFKTTDVLVWCPSYVEMAGKNGVTAWRKLIERLLNLSTSSLTQIIMVELPKPRGDDATAKFAAKRIAGINSSLERAAAGRSNVTVVATPAVRIKPVGEPLFDEQYYAKAAATIVNAIVARMR